MSNKSMTNSLAPLRFAFILICCFVFIWTGYRLFVGLTWRKEYINVCYLFWVGRENPNGENKILQNPMEKKSRGIWIMNIGVYSGAVALLCSNTWWSNEFAEYWASPAFVHYCFDYIFRLPDARRPMNHHEELSAFVDRLDSIINNHSLLLVEILEAWLVKSFRVGVLVFEVCNIMFVVFRIPAFALFVRPLLCELCFPFIEMRCTVIIFSSVANIGNINVMLARSHQTACNVTTNNE